MARGQGEAQRARGASRQVVREREPGSQTGETYRRPPRTLPHPLTSHTLSPPQLWHQGWCPHSTDEKSGSQSRGALSGHSEAGLQSWDQQPILKTRAWNLSGDQRLPWPAGDCEERSCPRLWGREGRDGHVVDSTEVGTASHCGGLGPTCLPSHLRGSSPP